MGRNFKGEQRVMKQFPTAFSVLTTIAAFAFLALIPSGCDFEKSGLEKKVDAFLKEDDCESAIKLVQNFLQQHPSEPVGRAMMVRVLAADGQTDRAFREYYRFYKLSKKISPQLLMDISRGALNHDDSSVRDSAAKTMTALDNKRNAKDLVDIANDGDGSGTAGDKRAVSAFIQALKDSNVSVRQTAVEMLGGLGDTRAVPALIETLKDNDVSVRRTAVEVLGDFGDTRAVPALIEALNDSNVWVRRTAVDALGGFGDKRAVPALIKILNDSKNSEGLNGKPYGLSHLEYTLHGNIVRLSAARTLGKLGDIRAVPALIRVLDDSDALERVAAAKALSDLGDERGVSALTNALNDSDDFVRALAAEALVGVADIGMVPALISALKNSDDLARDYDDLVRHHLAVALVELGDRSVAPVLIEILGGNESIGLKFWAAEALVKLSQ